MIGINKLARIGGLILPLLLLTTALSAPVVAADSSSCSGCDSGGSCALLEDIEYIDVTVENLKGSEATKPVSDALSNGDVKLLRKELVKEHYTPKVNKATAAETTVTVKTSDTVIVSGATIVKIPFKTHGKDLDVQIVNRDNGTSERAFATVSGPARLLEEPMDILEDNAKYQAIVENLEEQGYTVKKENAQVVKGYIPADYASVPGCIEDEVWNIAFVHVKAVKGNQVKNITALVCIDKGKVLSVADGYWDCMAECLLSSALDVGMCIPICQTAVAAPNPATVGACVGCLGAFGAYCAAQCAFM